MTRRTRGFSWFSALSGLGLLAAAAFTAPEGLTGTWTRDDVVRGESSGNDERRWIRVEVPAGTSDLNDWLGKVGLGTAHITVRKSCKDKKNREPSSLNGHSGELWVAAGDPEPRAAPPCSDD